MATINKRNPSDSDSEESEEGSSISEPDVEYDEEDVWEDGHEQADSPSVVLPYQFEPAAEHREQAAHPSSAPVPANGVSDLRTRSTNTSW